jgi:hypothetical protein
MTREAACCRKLGVLSVTRVVTISGRSTVIIPAKVRHGAGRPEDEGRHRARRAVRSDRWPFS